MREILAKSRERESKELCALPSPRNLSHLSELSIFCELEILRKFSKFSYHVISALEISFYFCAMRSARRCMNTYSFLIIWHANGMLMFNPEYQTANSKQLRNSPQSGNRTKMIFRMRLKTFYNSFNTWKIWTTSAFPVVMWWKTSLSKLTRMKSFSSIIIQVTKDRDSLWSQAILTQQRQQNKNKANGLGYSFNREKSIN